MHIINIKQNTDEWLVRRARRIGASDAATIMGVKTAEDTAKLIKRILTGETEDLSHIEAIKYGNEKEPEILAVVRDEEKIMFQPCVVDHQTIQFLSASLDGYDGGETGLEIKAFFYKQKPGQSDEDFREQGFLHGEKRWATGITRHRWGFYWQIVAQFASADRLSRILLAGYPVRSGKRNVGLKWYTREELATDIAKFEAEAQVWWQKHIVSQQPARVEGDSVYDIAVHHVVASDGAAKAAKTESDSARAHLLALMQERGDENIETLQAKVSIVKRESSKINWQGICDGREMHATEAELVDITTINYKELAKRRGVIVADFTEGEEATHGAPPSQSLRCTINKQ